MKGSRRTSEASSSLALALLPLHHGKLPNRLVVQQTNAARPCLRNHWCLFFISDQFVFHLSSRSAVGSIGCVSSLPNREHSREWEGEAAIRQRREQYVSLQAGHCWLAIGGTRKHWGHTSPLYCGYSTCAYGKLSKIVSPRRRHILHDGFLSHSLHVTPEPNRHWRYFARRYLKGH